MCAVKVTGILLVCICISGFNIVTVSLCYINSLLFCFIVNI